MINYTRKHFNVPICDVNVVIIITTNIPKSYEKEFEVQIGDTQMACLGYNKRKFVLFFEPKVSHRKEIIIHEIFHLTHRILEKCCMNFDENHHEMGAYLCEYLTLKVFKILRIYD